MAYNVNIKTLNTSTMDLNAVAAKLDTRAKKILGSITNNDSNSIVNTSSNYIVTGSYQLVGPNGTKLTYSYDKAYVRVDCAPTSSGYFTYKGTLGDTAAYCASLNN